MTSALTGLTDSEVLERRQRGLGNDVKLQTSRSYRHIVAGNLLNPINVILLAIGAFMTAIGRPGDAAAGAGLVLFNVVIGVIQEVRAKRQLDHIALLARPMVMVLRGGTEQEVDRTELVQGDVIVAKPGDQIVVDGTLREGGLGLDESLLTGESDLVMKVPGDPVLSGSLCINGSGLFEATRVGMDSYANRLTASARQYRRVRTPLQSEISLILRLLVVMVVFIGGTQLVAALLSQVPLMRQLQMASIITGLIPNGLLVTMVLAYAMGAVRISQRGALVQQVNGVESLSNVTVLCADKTGTLTANRITYGECRPVQGEPADLERTLATFARSTTVTTRTSEAIAAALQGECEPTVGEVAFSSARKWSSATFNHDGMRGTYVLGALESMESHLDVPPEQRKYLDDWSAQGMRVLAFAHSPQMEPVLDGQGEPTLSDLTLLGLLQFRDVLRPQVAETLAQFAANGIQLKIISGDSPQTVAALAKQAGFTAEMHCVSGQELAAMTHEELRSAAVERTIFGRITPAQKEDLVGSLREQGCYVAMIGDGVNDVLSLKKANVGIAMESGSAATRSVADMVLIGDSFESLPAAFAEGQRIVNGMRDILCLFLTRVMYSALLIVAVALMDLGFPFIPKHNTLMSMLTVGIPALALAAWSRPGPLPRKSMLAEIAHFLIPAGISIFVFGLLVYAGAFALGAAEMVRLDITPETIAALRHYAGITYDISTRDAFVLEASQLLAQTALTGFLVFAGLILVVFVQPPHQWFVGGDVWSGDRRPTILAVVLLLVFLGIALSPALSQAAELFWLGWPIYAALAFVAMGWMVVLRHAWRARWLERFLAR